MTDRKPVKELTERRIFDFLCTTYVQRADGRQRKMGLQYTTAETHELARTIAKWIEREGLTLSTCPAAGQANAAKPGHRVPT